MGHDSDSFTHQALSFFLYFFPLLESNVPFHKLGSRILDIKPIPYYTTPRPDAVTTYPQGGDSRQAIDTKKLML